MSGELYALDVASGTFSHLGYFLDPSDYDDADALRVRYLYGITLTAFEDSIIGVPIIATTLGMDTDTDHARLTTYDVRNRSFTKSSRPQRHDLQDRVRLGSQLQASAALADSRALITSAWRR